MCTAAAPTPCRTLSQHPICVYVLHCCACIRYGAVQTINRRYTSRGLTAHGCQPPSITQGASRTVLSQASPMAMHQSRPIPPVGCTVCNAALLCCRPKTLGCYSASFFHPLHKLPVSLHGCVTICWCRQAGFAATSLVGVPGGCLRQQAACTRLQIGACTEQPGQPH